MTKFGKAGKAETAETASTATRAARTVAVLTFFLAFSLFACPGARAQGVPPLPPAPDAAGRNTLATPEGREQIHLAALGTYSAGFVLEAYGYIGVLADVLHYGVYEPEIVHSMLKETRLFLAKSLDKIKVYRDKTVPVSADDLAYINGMAEILENLMDEADGLSDYSQSFDKTDYEKYKEARAKAWAGIKTHLGIK
ncbi:MAG: hypothetical protein LBF41_06370 [Deltaproteobacteria bacterium]|jgi:hypothetical protein|nr:hypothetical protein [Deltaproteobacteria bacterium]